MDSPPPGRPVRFEPFEVPVKVMRLHRSYIDVPSTKSIPWQ